MHGCGKVSNCYKDETDLLVFVLMWKKQQTHCSFKTTLKNVSWSPICGNTGVCFILITHKTVLKRHTKNHRMVRDYGWGGWGPFEDCMYVYIYIILQVSYLFYLPWGYIKFYVFFNKSLPFHRWWSNLGELKCLTCLYSCTERQRASEPVPLQAKGGLNRDTCIVTMQLEFES